jgi:hypothetical protein
VLSSRYKPIDHAILKLIGEMNMTKKPLKSWSTLASESKARRKTPLKPEQVEKLNKIFENIDKEQERTSEDSKRKIVLQLLNYGINI